MIPISWKNAHTFGAFDSTMEKKFFNQLSYYDIFVSPQHWVGPYRIDFAIPSKKLALEIDGAAWHTDLAKDSRKDEYLQKNGWVVERIPAQMIYKNKELGASKIAMQYFRDQLTVKQKRHAYGILYTYFTRYDKHLADLLMQEAQTLV